MGCCWVGRDEEGMPVQGFAAGRIVFSYAGGESAGMEVSVRVF